MKCAKNPILINVLCKLRLDPALVFWSHKVSLTIKARGRHLYHLVLSYFPVSCFNLLLRKQESFCAVSYICADNFVRQFWSDESRETFNGMENLIMVFPHPKLVPRIRIQLAASSFPKGHGTEELLWTWYDFWMLSQKTLRCIQMSFRILLNYSVHSHWKVNRTSRQLMGSKLVAPTEMVLAHHLIFFYTIHVWELSVPILGSVPVGHARECWLDLVLRWCMVLQSASRLMSSTVLPRIETKSKTRAYKCSVLLDYQSSEVYDKWSWWKS